MVCICHSAEMECIDKPDLLRCNVLIVEDNPETLLALRELLGAPDRNIVTAGSGEDALRSALMTDFAAILPDIRMQNMDGFATARLIRKREGSRNTPIIFLTGADEDAVSSFRGYEADAVDKLAGGHRSFHTEDCRQRPGGDGSRAPQPGITRPYRNSGTRVSSWGQR